MELETHSISHCSVNKEKKSSSKMQLLKSKAGKCHRSGPVLRNPYLNFLREFRKRNHGLSAVETVRRGAMEWKALPKEQKLHYIEAAFYAPKRRKSRPPPIPPPIVVARKRMDYSLMEGCCPKVTCGRKKRRKKKKKCKSRRKARRSKPKRCKKRRPRRRRKRC